MQSGINTPSSLRIPSERLDTISCATDTKSFCDKSEYDQILNDIVGIETPQRFKDRLQKHSVEPPSSHKKNNQITTKEPMEYIFAENQSSIYYTENLDNESCSQFGSESIKKCQSTNKMKECIVENDKSQKGLLASNKSEQQSRTSSTKNFRTNEKMNEIDNFEERSLCLLEKDSLLNGVIIDPVRVHEEKPFIVVSVLNDISGRKKGDHEMSSHVNTTTTSLASASKQGEDSLIMMKCQEELKQSEMQVNGLRNLKNQVSDFMSSLNQHRVRINQKVKEEERASIVPPPSKNETITQEIIEVPVESNQCYPELSREQDNTIEDIYIRKKEELDRTNRQLLEGDAIAENASESGHYHPFMKKTLSVIFSTNESIETNSHRGSRKNLGPGSFIKESDAFLHSQGRTNSRILMTQDSDSLKNKENIAVSGEKEGFMTVTASSAGIEDENLVNFVQTMIFHNKDNKELVGKLGKIIDLYNRQIEKYEMNNKLLREKNKKYSQGNELLIKTLKAFEKEMDKLVVNNQTLHKNIIFLQEEIKGYEIKQSSLKEVVMLQENMMNKLKEELKSKLAENEDFKCNLALRDTKIESLILDIQSCEDSMLRVSQILKETLTQKKSKITSKNLYTTFETIYSEIANFADNLNSNSKLRDSKNTILGARKDSGPIRPEEYLAYYDNNDLQSRKRDTKPIKNVSKSIDLSSSWKGSTYPSLLSQRAVINRHRQHSLVESSIFDNEHTYKELATRGRSRQVSSEKTKPRLDRSAPVRDSQSNNKPSLRTNKYALEADVEENLRKMLISNLRAKNSKYTQ